MNEFIPQVRASFVVDTLVYLHRGEDAVMHQLIGAMDTGE